MVLSCHNIHKSFGANEVLKGVSFHIEEHEKAAIVGINGAGKSTLLKIIIGDEIPDGGEVSFAKDVRVGYLSQQNMVSEHKSVYEEVSSAVQKIIDMENQLRGMEQMMDKLSGASLENLLEKYHRAQETFEHLGGYAWKSKVEGVLHGLGFGNDEFCRGTGTLSGGQKTRVALGKLLLSSPDIMLLDEPTNHLDMNSVEWLENYLLNYRGTVIVVAHDRYFLNKIASKIIEIDGGHAATYTGRYSDYYEKKKQLRQAQRKAWIREQSEIHRQEAIITKLKSFNRQKSVKRAESRMKMLSRMDRTALPPRETTLMRLTLRPGTEPGKDVLTAEHLKKTFQFPLFYDLNIRIRRGEKVALIGNNGAGKSTLLKILIGMTEADEGYVHLGANVHIGYYDQENQSLHPDNTLFQELRDNNPTLNDTQIRDTLASFMFSGEDAFKLVSGLSGGERGRLSLAKLMLSEANFLILDEPTNHLDINSKEILEDALCIYQGTFLCVSHDRWFINRVANRILELTDGTLAEYLGNYDYYLEKRGSIMMSAYEAPYDNDNRFLSQSRLHGKMPDPQKSPSGPGSGLPSGSAPDRPSKPGSDPQSDFTPDRPSKPGSGLPSGSAPDRPSKPDSGPQSDFAPGYPSGPGSALSPKPSSSSKSYVSQGNLEWRKNKEKHSAMRKKATKIKKTEDEIELLENRNKEIEEELSKEEIYTDLAMVIKLSAEQTTIASVLDRLYEEWSKLEEPLN